MRTLLMAWTASLALLFASITTARAATPPHGKPEIRVGIVLFDGVQIIDFAGPYEVFGQAHFGVATVSADGKPVTTAMGLKVTPDHAFADAPPFDVLLVPGGEVHEAMSNAAVLDFIRQRSAPAKQVMSVCTGTFILAASGLLDGLKATTFHQQIDGLKTTYPKITVVSDQRWVDNGKLITSAGLSSGMDAALHVVAKLSGEDAARSTALHLEYDWDPDQGFVRGRMADRLLPKLKDVEWPKDVAIHRLAAVGDEQQWRMHYRIETQTASDELMQRIVRSTESEGWIPDGGTAKYRWHRQVEGQRIVMAMATQPTDTANAFELKATLTVEAPVKR